MTNLSLENVAVMGAGAVGCYFGAMLARAGAKVNLIGRPAMVDAVRREGLWFDGVAFKGRVPLSATADPAGVAGAGLVLFCVKSADTATAAGVMAPHLAPTAVVLDLQNGVDNAERIRAHVKNLVVPAVVYVGAEIPALGVIRHSGRGDLVIGAADGDHGNDALIAGLAASLTGAGVPTRRSGNIEGELWWKLTLNCAYNAMSALAQTRYGPITAMAQARRVMSDAVGEIVALAEAKGIRIAMSDPVEAVLGFGGVMPNTKSSTAQDIELGRPTEIEYLNGHIVRECDRLGLPAPVNRTLYTLVKLLEERRNGAPDKNEPGRNAPDKGEPGRASGV